MRILVVRQSAIGDCVLTIPMVGALRRAFPDATIHWLVEKSSASLLRDHPWLDDVIIVPKGWIKQPREIRRISRRLKSEKYDVVLDPQGLLKSAVPVLLARAKRRIGFSPPQAREKSHWFYTDRVSCQSSHIVQKHLELLSPLGLTVEEPQFLFPEFASSRAVVGDFVERSHLSDRNWYVLFAGASWPAKRWETDRFARVAAQIAESRGWRAVVAWGSEAERQVAERIVAESAGSAVLADKLTLPELQVLVEQGEFYLGADTGPMHIAACSGTTCVALFGPTKPEKCGPVGTDHRVIQSYYQSGSTRERKRAANDAMRAIDVAVVLDACLELIDARKRCAA